MGKHGMRRVYALLAIVIGLWLALVPATAASASNGAVQIAGLNAPDTTGRCTDPGHIAASVMSGSLDGCWYIDTIDKFQPTPSGALYTTGTETFDGCLYGDAAKCGHFHTTFTFTSKWAGEPLNSQEIHGRCNHPITGGDGYFAGVQGVLHMHDLPNGCALYTGTLRF
jgi:hypothetical protein